MFILLESMFYFSPFYKKLVLLTIIISSLSTALWLAIGYIIIKQNRNRKYSWNYLAKVIGEIIFPKNQDTALNAYQIESQIKRSQSKDLADNFIEKIAEKINDVSPDEIIDKSSLFNTLISGVFFIFLVGFFLLRAGFDKIFFFEFDILIYLVGF